MKNQIVTKKTVDINRAFQYQVDAMLFNVNESINDIKSLSSEPRRASLHCKQLAKTLGDFQALAYKLAEDFEVISCLEDSE